MEIKRIEKWLGIEACGQIAQQRSNMLTLPIAGYTTDIFRGFP